MPPHKSASLRQKLTVSPRQSTATRASQSKHCPCEARELDKRAAKPLVFMLLLWPRIDPLTCCTWDVRLTELYCLHVIAARFSTEIYFIEDQTFLWIHLFRLVANLMLIFELEKEYTIFFVRIAIRFISWWVWCWKPVHWYFFVVLVKSMEAWESFSKKRFLISHARMLLRLSHLKDSPEFELLWFHIFQNREYFWNRPKIEAFLLYTVRLRCIDDSCDMESMAKIKREIEGNALSLLLKTKQKESGWFSFFSTIYWLQYTVIYINLRITYNTVFSVFGIPFRGDYVHFML